MCRPASFVVTKSKVYWSKLTDSHEEIINEFNLNKLDSDPIRGANLVRVEISPRYGDLSRPLAEWSYKLDQPDRPEWYEATDTEARCRVALALWAKQKLTGWNVQEAFHPIRPLMITAEPLSEAMLLKLLKEWASVRDSVRDSVCAFVGDSVWASVGDSVGDSVRASVSDSVGDSVWDSVWASVRDSVGASVGDSVRDSVWDSVSDSVWDSVSDSVWAYIGGLFPNITTWKYAEKLGRDPWRPLLTLWYAGYVPSFDGKTWRLHRGEKAEIVLTWQPEPTK